jgi:hypothetical protein
LWKLRHVYHKKVCRFGRHGTEEALREPSACDTRSGHQHLHDGEPPDCCRILLLRLCRVLDYPNPSCDDHAACHVQGERQQAISSEYLFQLTQ